MGPRGRFYPYLYHCDYIGLLGTCFMQVFYLGRAPRTKETLPEFLKWCRVTRHPLVFRRLSSSQRILGNGASQNGSEGCLKCELSEGGLKLKISIVGDSPIDIHRRVVHK